jgi:hypothetical protein
MTNIPKKGGDDNVHHHLDCNNDHDGDDAAHAGILPRNMLSTGKRAERARSPHELGRGHRRQTKPPNAGAMDTVSGQTADDRAGAVGNHAWDRARLRL